MFGLPYVLPFGLQPIATPLFSEKLFAVSFTSRVGSPSRFTRTIGRLAIVLVAVLATLALPASAQTQTSRRDRETSAVRKARIQKAIEETYTHRWEAAGGGGYLRFRSGEYLQKNSEIAFWSSATYFFNPKLGLTGEVRGAYGNAKIGNTSSGLKNPQISEYPFLAGPTYRVYSKIKLSASVFALGGTAIGKFDGGSKSYTAAELGMWPDTLARPAFSFGGNLDYNLYPNFAFRISPSYLGTTYGGSFQSNVGFEAGLLYRFGRQKK
jgi:hypothetical protein